MPISPTCAKCGNELNEFGAILFSPPNEQDIVKKWHLCKSCYKETIRGFE